MRLVGAWNERMEAPGLPKASMWNAQYASLIHRSVEGVQPTACRRHGRGYLMRGLQRHKPSGTMRPFPCGPIHASCSISKFEP